MGKGIIETEKELRELYLQTDLSNVDSVQETMKEIEENVYVEGKEKFLVALRNATPQNLAKARKYQNKFVLSVIMKNLGWGLMAIFFAAAMIFDDSGLFEESTVTWPYLGFWVGVGVQIYIAVLKSAWEKLTLSGAVRHPSLM